MPILTLKPRFITDEMGTPTAVMLSMEEFEEIQDRLDDLDDRVVIERGRNEPEIPHEEAVRQVASGEVHR